MENENQKLINYSFKNAKHSSNIKYNRYRDILPCN
jgi:hypothetical protein